MKQNIFSYTIAIIALSFFVACNKSQGPAPEESKKEQTISVHFEASTEDEHRLLQEITGEDGRIGRVKTEMDYKIRLFFRYGDNGQVVYHDRWFKAGEKRLTYTGEITLPPAGEGKLKSAAIVLEDSEGNKYAEPGDGNKVYNVPMGGISTEFGQQFVKLGIPYICPWKDMPNPDENGTYFSGFAFQPSGTVIRMYFEKNKDLEAKPEPDASFTSKYATQKWYYDFSNINLASESSKLMEGEPTDPNEEQTTITIKFKPVQGGKTPWYYICVMPTKQQPPAVITGYESDLTTIEVVQPLPDEYHVTPGAYKKKIGALKLGSTSLGKIDY